MKCFPVTLKTESLTTVGLAFLPTNKLPIKGAAIFAHGYTSHKGSILTWANRLVEKGVATFLLDLPGHRLGHFYEVKNFEHFTRETPAFFYNALGELKSLAGSFWDVEQIIIGGHSLGGLMALLAHQDSRWEKRPFTYCVGLGLPPENVTHVFDTPFYQSTLALRAELVSESLSPNIVFPWVKKAKEEISISGVEGICLTGEDDVVVPGDSTERFIEILNSRGNSFSKKMVRRLPHHTPEAAAGFLKKDLSERFPLLF